MRSNLGLGSLREGQCNRSDTRTKPGFAVVMSIELLNIRGEVGTVARRHHLRVKIEGLKLVPHPVIVVLLDDSGCFSHGGSFDSKKTRSYSRVVFIY